MNLTGWLKSLDREDRANDRAFYLEAFNGLNRYTYDRNRAWHDPH